MGCPHGNHLLPGECLRCSETPPSTPRAIAAAQDLRPKAAIKRFPMAHARLAVEVEDLWIKVVDLQVRLEDALGEHEAREGLTEARIALDKALSAIRVVKP